MKKIVYLVLVLVMFTACKINNKQNNIVTDDTDVVELVENETDDVETVDNTTEEIETVVSLGDWKEDYYKDEFGEDTNVKLAFQEVKGKYSEPDTDESSNMTAEIIVDAEDVLFRLKWLTTYESNADDIIFRIKDDNNNVSEFNMKANKSGYVKPNTEEEATALRNLLYKGGVLRVVATVTRRWGESYYKFSFNANGVENILGTYSQGD